MVDDDVGMLDLVLDLVVFAHLLFRFLGKLRFFDLLTTRRFLDLLSAVFRFLWSTSFPSPFLALPALTIFALAEFL